MFPPSPGTSTPLTAVLAAELVGEGGRHQGGGNAGVDLPLAAPVLLDWLGGGERRPEHAAQETGGAVDGLGAGELQIDANRAVGKVVAGREKVVDVVEGRRRPKG